MQVSSTSDVRDIAAEALESSAASLLRTASTSEGQLAVVAAKVAGALGCTAGYLRQNDIQDMAADVEQTVKRYPGASLAAAAGVGFLLGVVVRRR